MDVLAKDRFSLLASLCAHDAAGSDGAPAFIDRDWWLFRHILAFLREGTLPSSPFILKQLYVESAYYKLRILRDAIERRLAALRPTATDVQVLDGMFLDEAAIALRVPLPAPVPQPPPPPEPIVPTIAATAER